MFHIISTFISHQIDFCLTSLITLRLPTTDVQTQVLQYHILGAPHPSSDVPKSGSISVGTLLKGQSLALSTSGKTVKVQGASNYALVTVANIRAGASIVHIIDAVLVPKLSAASSTPPTAPAYATIAAAATAYNLTTLVQVVSLTPLLAAVTDPKTAVTVFAPTNAVSEKSKRFQLSSQAYISFIFYLNLLLYIFLAHIHEYVS